MRVRTEASTVRDFAAILSACTVIVFLYSYPFWFSKRTYLESSPFIDGLALPHLLEQVLFALFILSAASLALWKKPHYPLSVMCTAFLWWVISDQSHLHAWFMMYALFTLGLLLYVRSREEQQRTSILHAFRLFLCAGYFWSGVQKMNMTFAASMFPWFVAEVVPKDVAPEMLAIFGVLAPVFEAAIPFFLLSRKARNIGILMAIIMHVIAVGSLIAKGWNAVVWPWNIAYMLWVILLFRGGAFGWREVLLPKGIYHAAILLLILVMPLLHFVDKWDSYPSFSLYSGRTERATIIVDKKDEGRLPEVFREYFIKEDMIGITEWSIGELGVPIYPEKRIFKHAGRSFCKALGGSAEKNTVLVIQSKPHYLQAKYQEERLPVCDL